MRQLLIDIENNRVTSFWSDGCITWLPLDIYIDKYKKDEDDEDCLVLTQRDTSGFDKPRVIKRSYLIALLKNILHKDR